jgi:hypothetical protein
MKYARFYCIFCRSDPFLSTSQTIAMRSGHNRYTRVNHPFVFPALNANPTGDLAGPALGDRDAGRLRLQDLSGRLLKTTSQTSKRAPRSQTYCQRQQPEKTLPAKRESSQVTANAALNSSSRQEMVKFWKTIQPLPAQTVAAAALHLARNMPFGISDNRQVALRWGEQLNG